MIKYNNLTKLPFLLVIYLMSTLTFVFCHFSTISLLLPLRVISAFISLIIIPGSFVSAILLREESRNLGTSILLGLVIEIIETQLLFVIFLLGISGISLAIWLLVLNSCFVIFCLLYFRRKSINIISSSLSLIGGREFVYVLFIAIIVRIILAIIGLGAIAPDAALYADFARNVVEGRFYSNVLGDVSISNLWDGAQYVTHMAFTYIFAISWLILPPSVSGPTFLLLTIGVCLLFPIYTIAADVYNKKAGVLIALLVAIHPLFVFHSVIAYGPEITSLLFLLYGGLLLLQQNEESPRIAIISGILFGLVEVIWYANFYLLCIIIPILMAQKWDFNKRKSLAFTLLMTLVLLGRVFVVCIPIFYICWCIIFIILTFIYLKKSDLNLHRIAPYFVSMFATIILWRGTQHVSLLNEGILCGQLTSEPLVSVITRPIAISMAGIFIVFLFIHLTPTIFCLVLLSLRNPEIRSKLFPFYAAGSLGAIGTFLVFGVIRESLEIQYMFSDSRFFLFISLMGLLVVGGYLINSDGNQSYTNTLFGQYDKKTVFVFCLILLGFIPSYLEIPSGITMISFEERYGWDEIRELMNSIGDENTIFLADRARELSWLTERQTAHILLSERGLRTWIVGKQLISLSTEYNSDYLLIDSYSVAHWGTLNFLYESSIPFNLPIPLDIAEGDWTTTNTTGPITAITLIGATDPNTSGRYARLYRFGFASYEKQWEGSMLNNGWNVSHGAIITDYNGFARITIGEGSNYTYTYRLSGYNLELEVSSALFIFNTESQGAEITRIEVYSNSGQFIGYAESLAYGVYYLYLFQVTVGDIRVVVEGNPGESAIVKSFSIWQ